MLSAKQSRSADGHDGHDASLQLAHALLLEYCIGERSPFWGYLQSLPDRVELPSLPREVNASDAQVQRWYVGSEAHRRHLRRRGTASEISRDRLRVFLDEDRIAAIRGALAQSHAQAQERHAASRAAGCPSLQAIVESTAGMAGEELDEALHALFRDAYSLVSSRAFVVDTHHGLCLCPFADIFDHSDQHHTQLEADDDDDVREGQDDGDRLADMLLMRANTTLEGGEPVFNTYGETLDNAELLNRYGFALEFATRHECYSWDIDGASLDPRRKMQGPQATDELQQVATALQTTPDEVLRLLQQARADMQDGSAADARPSGLLCINAEGEFDPLLWRLAWLSSSGPSVHATGAREQATFRKLRALVFDRIALHSISTEQEREEVFDLLAAADAGADAGRSRDASEGQQAPVPGPLLLATLRHAEQEYAAMHMALLRCDDLCKEAAHARTSTR